MQTGLENFVVTGSADGTVNIFTVSAWMEHGPLDESAGESGEEGPVYLEVSKLKVNRDVTLPAFTSTPAPPAHPSDGRYSVRGGGRYTTAIPADQVGLMLVLGMVYLAEADEVAVELSEEEEEEEKDEEVRAVTAINVYQKVSAFGILPRNSPFRVSVVLVLT